MEDIRWQQRFVNFNKALAKLKEASLLSKEKSLSELEMEGLIQRFEYTYELSWKTLQDLLKFKGYNDINGPGPVLSKAFDLGLIENADAWRRLKKSRELTSHTYDSDTAEAIATAIQAEFVDLFLYLQYKLEEEVKGKEGNLFE